MTAITDSSRVGVDINPTPVTEVPQISITPTRIQPHPFSAFIEATGNLIPTLAKMSAASAESNAAGLIVKQVVDEATASMANVKTEVDYTNLRSNMGTRALELWEQAGLDTTSLSTINTLIKKYQEVEFAPGRVKTQEKNGLRTITIDGDIVSTDLDREGLMAYHLTRIQDTMPELFKKLMFEANGIDETGAALPGDVAAIKQAAQDKLFHITAVMQQMEDSTFHTNAMKAMLGEDQAKDEVTKFFFEKKKSVLGQGFRKLAAATIQDVLASKQWMNVPPEAAVGEIARRLDSLRNNPEFSEYEVKAKDLEFFPKLIAEQMTIANNLVTGLNTLKLKQYNEQEQAAIIKMVANEHMLSLGPQAIAMLTNAENMMMLAQGAVASMTAQARGISDENPLGATLKLLQTGYESKSIEGLLTIIPSKQPQNMTGDIASVIEQTQSIVKGALTDSPETGFAAYSLIMSIKSNPGVARWLNDASVPQQYRQNLIDTLNQWQAQLEAKGGLSKKKLEEFSRKKWSPDKVFESGAPTMDEDVKPKSGIFEIPK